MQEYKIRDFQPADYPRVIKLWEATGLGNPTRGDDFNIIQKSIDMGGKFFVMETAKEIIGCSWITFDGRRLYLHHFGIKPELQGKGLSKPLLEKSLGFAKEKKVQIKLEVHKNNEAAIQLYTKAGFKYLGDYDVYIIRDF